MTAKEPNIGWTEALGEHAGNPPNPRTSGETLFACGQEWTFSSDENRIKGQVEKYVRAEAMKCISELEGVAHPDTIRSMLGTYVADRGAQRYNWDGGAIRTFLADVPGMKYLLYLCLRRCHPDVTLEDVDDIWREKPQECGTIFGWIMGNLNAPAKKKKTGANGKAKETATFDGP